MIIVDVVVPIIDKTYDFSIDENTAISTIVEDIVDLIMQKEGVDLKEAPNMNLFSFAQRRILDHSRTLDECGIDTGDKLVLV